MKKLLLSVLCLGAMSAYAGTGTEADPYTCAEVIAMGADLNVESATVKGYIVGFVDGQAFETGAHFTATGAGASNLLMADSKDETEAAKCIPVQLVSGTAIRADLNLKDNPGNLGAPLEITGQLIKYFNVPGVKAPTAYKLNGQAPEVPVGEEFILASTVTSGKMYAIVCDGNVAKPLAESSSYGFLYVDNVTVADNKIETVLTNGFIFTAVDGGYTIQDTYGRYMYMTGTYNSFNFSASRGDGDVWTVEAGEGGWKITNVAKEKYIQYYAEKVSYGAYADATGALPQLFEYTGTIEPPTPPETADYNSIADFLAAKSTAPARFLCPLSVAYQNGAYLYVTDGTDPLLIYGTTGKTYTNGDVIPAGVTGTYKDYNGQPELVGLDETTFGDPDKGDAVEPEIYQLEELSPDLVSAYIKVLAVTVAGTDGAYTLSDGTQEIALYNRFNTVITPGEYSEFEGFVSVFNGTVQLYPIKDLGEEEPTPEPVDDPNVAVFYAPLYEGVIGVPMFNNDGTSKSGDNTAEEQSLCGASFSQKGVSVEFTSIKPEKGTQYFSGAYDKEVRWYKGNTLTVTPADGVTVKQIFVKTVANSKGAFSVPVGTVDGSGEGASNPITWTGEVTEPMVLTAEAAIRFAYIQITLDFTEGVETINAADDSAPVEYFNLQGVRVANPENGLFIRRQGSVATKVLVK